MNRRRMLSSICRSIARHAEAPAVASGDNSTIERMSIADLDRLGPRLVTTKPREMGRALTYGSPSGQSAAPAGGSGSEGRADPAQVVSVSPIACRGTFAGSDDCAVKVASRESSHADDSSLCIFCTSAPASDTNYPYCSAQCAINAENC